MIARFKPRPSMRTVGVDLSATPKRTAIASIEWGKEEATVTEPSVGLSDAELVGRLAQAEWVGIDAPFGWPEAMVAALYSYSTTGCWSGVDKEAFRYRRTDRFVHDTVFAESGRKLWPLSVSSDRLALTARRTAQLREHAFEGSGVRFDRTGADRVVEVYPTAALAMWGLERISYKTSGSSARREDERQAREALLISLEARAPWLTWEPGSRDVCVESDDALDAVVAALIARTAALGLTTLPQGDDVERARVEGWIHLPQPASLSVLYAPH